MADIEEKFKLLYESVGSPRCRHFSNRGNECKKSDQYNYATHFTYSCCGNICDCDFDEKHMKKVNDEETFHARNAS